MICFEAIKRDFGLKGENVERDLSPINLGIPTSEYYDHEERLIRLS
jgi:hypothetical protein